MTESDTVARRRSCFRLGAAVVLLQSLAATGAWGQQAWGQQVVLEDQPPPAGVFATLGVGVVDVDAGSGLDVPVGITAVSPSRRVLVRLTAVDLGLLQKSSTDPRYQRLYSSAFSQEVCFDTATNRLVPFGRCAGKTDVLRSASIDLNVLPVKTLYVGNRAGSLHVGLGLRLQQPRTVYGTLGMFFPARSGRAVGVRLAMGREYIFVGFTWGLGLGRVLEFF